MIFVRLARREPGGAKGLLESMAAGNKQWYRPLTMKGKGKVNIVLHRSNGEAVCGQPIPFLHRAGDPRTIFARGKREPGRDRTIPR